MRAELVEQAAGSRERKKLQTRKKLEDAAWRLFEGKGFDQTTVDDISAAAGVAPRTFFRHFPSKEAVVFCDHQEDLAELRTALWARPAEESLADALRGATVTLMQVHYRDPTRAKVRVRLSASTPSVAAYGRQEVLREWERMIGEWVAARLDVDEFRDLRPRFYACVAVGALQAATVAWVYNGCEGDFAPLIEQAFALLPQLADGTIATP